MEIFETNSLVVLGAIIGMGIVLAPIIKIAWTMRILIASYIALGLVLLMPDRFAFNLYADIIYFAVIVFVVALAASGRFFDISEWIAGRFSFQAFGITVLTLLFIVAISFLLLPFSYINFFMTGAVYDFMTDYIFYFAAAPLVFAALFAKHV